MKNIMYITIALLLGSQVFANDGSLKITMKSSKTVVVESKLKVTFEEEKNIGFSIPLAVVRVEDLAATPSVVTGSMRSKKMLNMNQFPEIYVTDLACYSLDKQSELSEKTGTCKGQLKIKGKEKSVLAIYQEKANVVKIRFNFLLSDFDIARKVLIFKIENIAQAEVTINKE